MKLVQFILVTNESLHFYTYQYASSFISFYSQLDLYTYNKFINKVDKTYKFLKVLLYNSLFNTKVKEARECNEHVWHWLKDTSFGFLAPQ